MQVAEAWLGEAWGLAASFAPREGPLLAAAALACEDAPFDPMEQAILDAARSHVEVGAKIVRHYGLSDRFLAVATVRRTAADRTHIAMKGAPESVVSLCRLDPGMREAALAAATDAAGRGLRVLAVAQAAARHDPLPDDPRDFDWRFIGLVALADPLRENVPAAIALCRRAGIRVVMITGDHPATARAIGRQAGLDASRVLTGREMESLDGAARAAAVKTVQVFARVRPEQKLMLVQALRDAGEVVAMTGDGVNDAPALKAAHIGVAMGQRGTDVAREAAALVLLEDDFTALVGTIRLGRRIYDNIRNAMSYLVAVHVPLAGMALLPLALGWPQFLYPLHVVFLEFVIDPACTLVFEAEHSDPDVMERSPRPPRERLFTLRMLLAALTLGAVSLAVVCAVYGMALAAGTSGAAARALAFSTLVCSNVALIVAHRSGRLTTTELLARRNPVLWAVVAAAAVALALVVCWPALAGLFRFERPSLGAELGAIAAGLGMLIIADVPKRLRHHGATGLTPVNPVAHAEGDSTCVTSGKTR
jgi:Ca2+-transporting ATPase